MGDRVSDGDRLTARRPYRRSARLPESNESTVAITSATANTTYIAEWVGCGRDSQPSVAGQNTPIHRRIVRFYGLPLESGVLVVSTEEKSPAAAAGLRQGDVIVAYGSSGVGSIDDLHRLLTGDEIGVRSTVTFIRGTERLSVEITPAGTA